MENLESKIESLKKLHSNEIERIKTLQAIELNSMIELHNKNLGLEEDGNKPDDKIVKQNKLLKRAKDTTKKPKNELGM